MSNIGKEIDLIKEAWGTRLLVLGHHYQRSSVLQHADELGDSLELSRKAASHSEAERIVFCGVRFMAESADILTNQEQSVYMPETSAGCPMADMGSADAMQNAWNNLQTFANDWIPVVYVNSSAEVKALCGKWGGSACTSGNAEKVISWAISQGKRVFFLPDEHLAVNTAHDMGISDEEIAVYDPLKENGGLAPEQIRNAKILAWKGFCIVHISFTPDHVRKVRELLPDARIIVHPEAPYEVVKLCDEHGSTSHIIKYVEAAAEGSTIVIGTEINLVERLAEKHRGRVSIKALSPSVCANMAKTNEKNLLNLLKDWPDENKICVPENIVKDARKALTTMLEL